MDLSLKIEPQVANWAILAFIVLVGALAVLVANNRRPLFPRATKVDGDL
jgi:hypothetical protein